MGITLEVNGRPYRLDVADVEPLADVLRERLGLTGTKVACAEGTCGSCTVILDGRPVLSCLTLATACDGAEIRTVAEDGFQCGFCTPGQLMSALALLERTPEPSREEIVEAMSGNLCRCGAYEGIGNAIERAAKAGA
jgi:aerobic-type carbon monoxide dehydrogenase small subunit (CoxS/CutS family)